MQWLVLGLILFLGVHSVRIVAEPWRQQMVERVGLGLWRTGHAALSALGLALIIWGYGLARQAPVVLWSAPLAMRHAASLLTLVAFVLLVATFVPGNAIKARLEHPMALSIKLWALAHLLANGTVADVLLFGGFLVWAVFDYRSARRRSASVVGEANDEGGADIDAARTTTRLSATVATLVVGMAAWALFAFWAHGAWIGVRPFAFG